MSDLMLQFLALPLLGLGIWLGYRRWIEPRGDSLDGSQRALLLLILLTLVGGIAGSSFWWFDVQRSFSWDLPPLASRMLAAAGWAFGVACWFALDRPTRSRTRLIILMLAVYLLPLALAIVLFHLDYFDLSAPISYAFFIIAIGIAITAIYFLVRPPAAAMHDPEEDRPGPLLRGWLIAVMIVAGLWGLALFLTDSGPSALIWVWPGDLLTSRLIGVMLLTVAIMATASMQAAHVARQSLAAIAVYGAGLAIAALWNALAELPVKWGYTLVFGIICIVSLILYSTQFAQDGSRA